MPIRDIRGKKLKTTNFTNFKRPALSPFSQKHHRNIGIGFVPIRFIRGQNLKTPNEMTFDDLESQPNSKKVLHAEISYSIIGSAIKVLKALKPGLNEKAYENALVIELRNRGHRVDQQQRFDVFYEGIKVDTLIPDLLVDDLVIVDPKVVTSFNETHVAQMMGYLAITGLNLAILLNFKHASLQQKRVVR